MAQIGWWKTSGRGASPQQDAGRDSGVPSTREASPCQITQCAIPSTATMVQPLRYRNLMTRTSPNERAALLHSVSHSPGDRRAET